MRYIDVKITCFMMPRKGVARHAVDHWGHAVARMASRFRTFISFLFFLTPLRCHSFEFYLNKIPNISYTVLKIVFARRRAI